MVQYVVRAGKFSGDEFSFLMPENGAARERIRRELDRCASHGGFALVTIAPPKRPRTTGKGSQNHHLNGHIMQLCAETGNSYDTVKGAVKMIAVEQMGFPYTTIAGHIVPQGESACGTEECAKLIEAAHILAADYGIILQE